jgi:hypothetical protein
LPRKSISKKLRFTIFKRDLFVCQYCGRKPPAVVLQVDHVVAVAEGGSNEEHNLITSCFDCNNGKGAGSLAASPLDVANRSALLAERIEQTKQYEALLSKHREVEEESINQVVRAFEIAFDEQWTLPNHKRPSIRNFLKLLPPLVVVEAMELACSRMNEDYAFRYFCGICWRKIRGELP